jgi:hypothetical protein
MTAAQGSLNLTLLDIAKRTDPYGAVPIIAELLAQKNEVMNDIPWLEGNLPTGTRNTLRTGLPQAFWKVANTGTNSSKSTTAQIDEACGILEAWSVIDYDVAQLNGNVQKYRLSEADAFIEALSQQLCGTLWYGNTAVNTERFMGFSPRFGAISSAINAQNILNANGTGATNASVWLIGWGMNSVYGIYPRGTVGGLVHKDWGERIIQTSVTLGNGYLHAYVDKWQWKCGLAVKDWRYVVRCANVSIPDLTGGSGTQNAQQLIKLMSRMMSRLPSPGGVTPVFYMNRTMYSMLRVQSLDKSQNALGVVQGLDQFGHPLRGTLVFDNIPIRLSDQLLLTESAIS